MNKQPDFLQIKWQFIRHKDTTLLEKIILIEIFNLSQKQVCNASNEHFSNRLEIAKSSVSRSISSLERKGYINTVIKPNTRNFDRTITINNLSLTINNLSKSVNKLLFDLLTICIESKENIENKNIEVNIKESKPKKKTSIFKKPAHEEIQQYLIDKNKQMDINHFYDFYESKNWMVGRNKMKCWKSATNNWIRNNNKFTGSKNGTNQSNYRKESNFERNERIVKELLTS